MSADGAAPGGSNPLAPLSSKCIVLADPHPDVAGPVTGEQVGHFHVHAHPAGSLAQAYQDVAGAVVPGLLPGAHLAAAAFGADQRVVTVGVQRGLPASAAEGARLAQWQAEVPCEPHPVCPPDVVVRVVRVVVAVLIKYVSLRTTRLRASNSIQRPKDDHPSSRYGDLD